METSDVSRSLVVGWSSEVPTASAEATGCARRDDCRGAPLNDELWCLGVLVSTVPESWFRVTELRKDVDDGSLPLPLPSFVRGPSPVSEIASSRLVGRSLDLCGDVVVSVSLTALE